MLLKLSVKRKSKLYKTVVRPAMVYMSVFNYNLIYFYINLRNAYVYSKAPRATSLMWCYTNAEFIIIIAIIIIKVEHYAYQANGDCTPQQ